VAEKTVKATEGREPGYERRAVDPEDQLDSGHIKLPA
jgi:hypothetical protein